MKKSLVAAMFAVMMISLVGCGKASEPKTIETTEVVEESETVEEATEIVEETTETEEVAEEPTEAPAAEEPVAEEPASPYSYTDLSQTMYAQSTVNVRDLPEQTGAKLGSLSTNQEVTVTGQCNETGWYKISYNGGEGFVSNSYLGSEKVAVKSKSSSATQSTSQAPAQEAAAEAPAATTDDNTYSGMTTDQLMDAVDAGQIAPDVYLCPVCGFETPNRDEYIAHMQAEGMPYGN